MTRKLFLCFCVLLLTSSMAKAQKTVTGTVSDVFGSLPGASIVEKGTNNGVATNFDGEFSIEVSNDNAILEISFIGYVDKEVSVAGKTNLTIILEDDAQALDEIVVNALGLRVDKKSLGVTFVKINSEKARRSGEKGVINSLAGKASGVRIARSNGDPGAGSTIQIRGANTITGNTQPLIIIDGVPISNDNLNGLSGRAAGGTSQQSRLNDINQEDIETINILKGASAAAVWGSEAANGVIVITTKSGKNNSKVSLSFNSSVSFDQINRRHPLQSTYGQGSSGKWESNNSRSWGDKIENRSGGDDIFNTSGEYFKSSDETLYYPITSKNSKETYLKSNFDEAFKTGIALNNSINVSGGGEKGTYYLSLANLNHKGIIKNSFLEKTNISLSSTYKFNNWLKAKSKFNYIESNSNRIEQSSNVGGLYLGLLRTPADFNNKDYIGTYYSSVGKTYNLRQRSYRNYLASGNLDKEYNNPRYNNPGWTVYEQEGNNKVSRVIFNTEFTAKPYSWVDLIGRFGIDSYSDNRFYFFPYSSASSSAYYRASGRYEEEEIKNKVLNINLISRFGYDISENITSNFTFGYNYLDKTRHSIRALSQNFLFNTRLRSLDNSIDEDTETQNRDRYFKSYRIYGIASFELYNQLYVNISVANEFSSAATKSVIFPSVDISYLFTESDFFDVNFLNYGKLRASFGQVGVQPQPHRFNTTYENFIYNGYSDPLNPTFFGGSFRLNDDKGNTNLKPEIKTEFEIGTDVKFLDSKLSLNLTYYQNQINDILFNTPLSPSTGFNEIYSNAGKMENKGFEIDLNYDVFSNDNTKVSLYGNFNKNKNTVLDLNGATSVSLTPFSVSSRAVVGHSLGTLWGSTIKRKEDGKYDLDKNGFIQKGPDGVIGDPNPDWRGGIGLSAEYKSFDFNILFETSQGGDFSERTRFILGNFGAHADVGNEVTPTADIKDVKGNIHPAGVPVRGNIKDFGAGAVLLEQSWYTGRGGGFGDSPINELSIYEDGSWTRLREISLGYTLNSDRFKESTGLSSLRLSITGRNLKLWTDVVGIDPEINQTGVSNGFGIEYFTNPSTQSFLFTLQLKY